MDLQEPSRKMSTTGGTAMGTVLLLDPPEVVMRKFKSAVTDSGREIRRGADKAGISNLIEIMSVASGESMDEVERRFEGAGYGQFKQAVGEAVVAVIEPIRQRYLEFRSDPGELTRLLAVGARKAAAQAEPTLTTTYERMGFTRASRG